MQIEVDGGAVSATVTGTGPTLVLFHSLLSDAASFSRIVPLLAPRFRVVVPDLPGFGGSTAVAGPGLPPIADRMAAALGLQYEERRVHSFEQDRIADAAGALASGAVGPWSVSHDIPIEEDEHGEVAVIRAVGSPAIECKEIIFSVDTMEDKQPRRAFYTATVCHDGPRWKWASAEPATARWGSLQ